MSEVATVTLADFLLARIAEDEAAANDRQIENVPTDCWDPSRVRAECEAKRRIVEAFAMTSGIALAVSGPCVLEAHGARISALADVCYILAAVYADHPDYRPEWRA